MSAKQKRKCHICEEITKSEIAPESCSKCGANLADPQQERVLMQTYSQYSGSANTPIGSGELYLTNKRLVWVAKTNEFNYGGGLPVYSRASIIPFPNKWGFSLPLEDVESLEKSQFGRFIEAFIVTSNDGTKFMLSAKPADEWLDAIMKEREETEGFIM